MPTGYGKGIFILFAGVAIFAVWIAIAIFPKNVFLHLVAKEPPIQTQEDPSGERPCDDVNCCNELKKNFLFQINVYYHGVWSNEQTKTDLKNNCTYTLPSNYNKSATTVTWPFTHYSMNLYVGLDPSKNPLDPCCDIEKVTFKVTWPDGREKKYRLRDRVLGMARNAYNPGYVINMSPRIQSGKYTVEVFFDGELCFTHSFTLNISKTAKNIVEKCP